MRTPISWLLFLLCSALFAQNPNTAIFPGADATDANLFVATNGGLTTLGSTISSGTTSVLLTSAAKFTAPVVIAIQGEIIHCQTLIGSTLSSCSRGQEGSTAAAHTAGVTVQNIISAWHHNQVAAEVKAIEDCLTAGTAPCNGGGGGGGNCTVAGSNGDLQMKSGSACAASHANDTGSVFNISEPTCIGSCADTSGLGGTASAAGLKSGTCTGNMTGSDIAIRDCGGALTAVGASTSPTLTLTIASGTVALATSAISGGACQTVTAGSVNSATATGVLSTDSISWTPNGSIKAVNGYIPGGSATTYGLSIVAYPTAGYVNFDVCNNNASGSITPGALTVNYRVGR